MSERRDEKARIETLEMSRKAAQAERRAEDAEAAIEAARDLLDGWEHGGPDDPAIRLLIQRVREMLDLGERFREARHETERAVDGCPLGKASCDPLANGCDGECESEWASYACTGDRHGECGGVAWQPDVACQCACHDPLTPTGLVHGRCRGGVRLRYRVPRGGAVVTQSFRPDGRAS